MITVKDLSYAYGDREVLREIEFYVNYGETLFIVGPNGSGKTTLLKCLANILKPKGAIYIEGQELLQLPRREIAKRIGYLPQRGEVSNLTVFDAILLGRKPYMSWGPSQRDLKIVNEIVDALELKDLALRRLTELSGGELQKVLIARALVQEPKIILLDEPTNNLDLKNQVEIMKLLKRIVIERGVAAIITTHDLNLAALYADKIIMLKEGRITAIGGVDVLNPENIEKVYGVKPKIVQHDGRPIILPADGESLPISSSPLLRHAKP